jgi:hypothetical protein
MTKHPPFVMLPCSIFDSPEYRALRPVDRDLLWLLVRKHNGINNGNLALGVREAARHCHCSQMSACRAFANLQRAGLISATLKGHLVPEFGRPNVATHWRLNFIKEPRA